MFGVPQHARGEIALLVNPAENRAKMVAPDSNFFFMVMQLPGRTWEFRSRDERQIEKCIAAFKQLADRRAAQMQQDSGMMSRDFISFSILLQTDRLLTFFEFLKAAERKPQTEMPAMVDHSNYDTNPGPQIQIGHNSSGSTSNVEPCSPSFVSQFFGSDMQAGPCATSLSYPSTDYVL